MIRRYDIINSIRIKGAKTTVAKILKNKKAVIFDLDGTLADTISAITNAVNLTMEHFSYPKRDEDSVRRAVGNGATNLIRRLVPKELSDDMDTVRRARNKYDDMYALTYMQTEETYDGIKEALHVLKNVKGLKIAVFSNKQDEYVKAMTEKFFPDGTVSVARGQTELPIKPDPAGIRPILDELGVTAEECVFVGDSGVDTETAKNANMDFIGVAWGFWGRERLLESGAEIIIDSPSELTDIIC